MKDLLSDSIDHYMRHRTSQSYSKGTLKVDRQVLTKFLAVSGNIYCHQITHRHVERHFEEVSKTRQAASLKNDHGVLVRFFKWARHTGRMPVESDPMFGRRQPKSLETWHCVATRDVVEFVRRDYFARASWSFAREQFLVAGALPAPAV